MQNNKVRNQHFYYLYAWHNKTTPLLSLRATVSPSNQTHEPLTTEVCVYIYKYFKRKLRC